MTAVGAHILVVEDHDDNRELLVRYLSRHGYAVSAAADGAAAFRSLLVERPDMILLDIKLPEMDGQEVLYLIRQVYSPRELPVIMVTAQARLTDAIESLAMGANDYVTKPIELALLLVRMRAHLGIFDAALDLAEPPA